SRPRSCLAHPCHQRAATAYRTRLPAKQRNDAAGLRLTRARTEPRSAPTAAASLQNGVDLRLATEHSSHLSYLSARQPAFSASPSEQNHILPFVRSILTFA